MKMKKRLSLLTAAALASSAFAGLAFAETEDDLATISSNATFIAQNETTETFARDSIHWNNQLLTLNGDNTYNTKKGNSLFNDTEVQNLLQVKQGRNMVLSVGGACTIDVYHDDNSGRIIQAGSTNRGTDYTVVQNVLANGTKNYDVDTITVPTAGLVYIGASGDVFVSVIDVKFDGGDPNPTEAPEATEAPAEPTAAPAEPAELQAVSEATTWTAANFVAGDAETTVISDNGTLALNGTEKAKITVDGTKRIKMNGKGRVIELLPAAAGTVEVEFTHASSTPSDTRTLTINQNDAVAGSESVDAETTSATASASVTADASVTITSDAALNISSIKFTPGAPVEPPAPVVYTVTLVDGETSTPTEVEENGTFTFPTPDARVGAEFGGWKNLDNAEDIKNGGESITVTGDAAYEAVWNPVVAPVVDPTFVVEKIGVFTEDAGNPAAAFKGEVTAGTYAIEGLYWRAYNGKAYVDDYDVDVTVAADSNIVLGLIIEVEDNGIDVNGVNAAIFAADVR